MNKPFKDRLREQWEAWMINEGIERGTTSPPTREDISKWSVTAMQTLPTSIVRNAWRHGEYTWFQQQEERGESDDYTTISSEFE